MEESVKLLESEEEVVVKEKPVSKQPSPPKVALCLSGGGYRAALFHLGVLRCLHEMGILQSVTTISSVSGGSIISAYLAKRMVDEEMNGHIHFVNWEQDVSKGFREFTKKDVRTWPMLIHLPWNWLTPKWRARHLQWNYDRALFRITENNKERSLQLSDLPTQPEFVFCATDLTFGTNWEFTRDKVGSYKAGTANKGEWPVALAVTASSSFPPVFGPLRLELDPKEFKTTFKGRDHKLLKRVKLNDGGVYDNLGLEPAKRHKVVLISDGGSPFGYMGIAGPIKRIARNLPVIMNQVGSLRKRMYFTGITKKWHTGVYVDIGHERTSAPEPGSFDGYVDEEVREMIAGIRTDLDHFSDEESKILENHGYFEMYRRIIGKAPELIVNESFKPKTPHPDLVCCGPVKKALKWSHKRKLFGIPLPI